MWPGQQPPGGEQNPQDQHNPYQQPGYQQPNPYQQPGYQQPNPYGQQPQWDVPQQPQPAGGGGGGGNRTKVTAIVAALAVVAAAGVTGFLVLGGDNKDDEADGGSGKTGQTAPASKPATDPSASASGSDDNPRGGEEEKATIAGWKVVINPKWGTAFDVPADWQVETPGMLIGFEDAKGKAGDPPLITMSAPAYFKEQWCTADDDKDGDKEDTALAAAGTKGANGAKSADEVALNQVAWWVYGGYTQPDKKSITVDKTAKPFTTTSGVEGSVAWARSKNTPQKGKCASDGKAVTFGFKNSKGDYVAFNLYGATGVSDELPDETIDKILSTVRLHGEPTG
ncbi:hypothetical protein [Streptomyces sp. S.PB5]|uniref:hypothetical protein n=1 Tax=Streptomyces sp. S.PB5 TaxID=3020844 RepID=UPI0025B1325D|nr:hypothetical protein [Streptomyces sp. S.PB5]MDN3027679.1 hypothetical protein [Streptomyces sp. S.PB5]